MEIMIFKFQCSQIKFYWNIATLTHLHHDCFQSSCDKDLMGHKAENIYYLALHIKSLPWLMWLRRVSNNQ